MFYDMSPHTLSHAVPLQQKYFYGSPKPHVKYHLFGKQSLIPLIWGLQTFFVNNQIALAG